MRYRLKKVGHFPSPWRDPALSLLLAVEIILIFGIAPLVSAGWAGYVVLGLFQSLIGALSYFVVATRPERLLLLLSLGLMVGLTVAKSYYPVHQPFNLGFIGANLLFVVVLLRAVGQAVFADALITVHRIRGGMVLYLTLALLFLSLFVLLETWQPGAFSGISTNARQQYGQLLYFSLVTLSSTGYGDVLPLHPLARSLATCEAITGQLSSPPCLPASSTCTCWPGAPDYWVLN
ncbi:MAG: potassium channel family protein [Bacteroidota bacterium]|nr:potassium channel family protein [Bacteroidota bacterium]